MAPEKEPKLTVRERWDAATKTLAGRITICRILLFLPAVPLMVLHEHLRIAFVFLALAAFTDLADGMVARRKGTESRAGAWLDIHADIIFLIAVFLAAIEGSYVPWSFGVFFLGRDLIVAVITCLLIWGRSPYLRCTTNFISKFSAGGQMTYVAAAMVNAGWPGTGWVLFLIKYGLWLVVIAALVSGLDYCWDLGKEGARWTKILRARRRSGSGGLSSKASA